jgi:tetratricopeptide (TPR) repeat protein/predicted Ser/Thr protein kinase
VPQPSLEDTQASADGFATLDARSVGPRTSSSRATGRLDASDVVGRYVVLSKLGAGGMGVVYAAYDPELDRKVALKLLLTEPGSGTQQTEGRERLLREAQALAKFSHPEIVAIYDVGEHQASVWLAMEFVDGHTLGAWAQAQPRSWAEILEVMIAAGRGVAAAHAAGLIHRDLKPDNIMIGRDGRVRVMDFGLTRPQTDLGSTPADGMMGTPAYMAPEQFSGGELTAATDQFAYCVTLWELLFGQRPFAGRTLVEMATSVLEGKIQAPPKAKVPSWLRRACERGLSVEPSKRWPSMQELLAELGRGQTRARLRNGAIGLGLVAAAVGAVMGWQRIETRDAIAACEAQAATISAVWNDERRHVIEQALQASGATYTADVSAKLMPWLDQQAQAWQAAQTEVCLHDDQRTRAEPWAAETLDRAQWCLDDRRMEFDALLAELSGDNPLVASRAVQAAVGLSPIDVCLDQAWLARLPAPPVEGQTEVEAVRAKLSQVAALQATGNFAEGIELARASLTEAEALAWPPLTALARLRLGMVLDHGGKFEEAATLLADAYFEAAEVDAHELAADAATRLVLTIGLRLARHDEGRTWSRHAKVALGKFPDPQQLRQARLSQNLAHIARTSEQNAEARQLLQQALEIRQRALGDDHPDLAHALANLALVAEAEGQLEEARALYERALAIIGKQLGGDHPEAASILNNLAEIHRVAGEFEQAKQVLERSLAIKQAAYGPEHPQVASSLSNLALVYEAMGKPEEARPLHEQAIQILEKSLGPKHPELGAALNNYGENLRLAGEYEQAVAVLERALAIKEEVYGPQHTSVGLTVIALTRVYQTTGDFDRAKPLGERALAIFEQLDPEHPNVAYSLSSLAEIALAQARPADALPLAERSLAIFERGGARPLDVAALRFTVAEALWATGERAKAIEQAEQTRDILREAGANETLLADVERWLAEHSR